MLKTFIPQYSIDEMEIHEIQDSIYFAISPYLEELTEEDKKIFNSFLSKEKIYTEKILVQANHMLGLTERIIKNRIDVISEEITKLPPKDESKPAHPYYVLMENYNQQIGKIDNLKKIFEL